jgi:hypothetical protein
VSAPRLTPVPSQAPRVVPELVPQLPLVAACASAPAYAWVTDYVLQVVQEAGPLIAVMGGGLLGRSIYDLEAPPEGLSAIVAGHELALRGVPGHYTTTFRGRVFRCSTQAVFERGAVVGVLGVATLTAPTPAEMLAFYQALALPAQVGPRLALVSVVDVPLPTGRVLPARTEIVLRTPDPAERLRLPVWDATWVVRHFELGVLALAEPLPVVRELPAATPAPPAATPVSAAPRGSGAPRAGAHRLMVPARPAAGERPAIGRGPLRLVPSEPPELPDL